MNRRYMLLWLLLAAVAVINGLLRQATYGKYLPELAAHQVSTVSAIVLSAFVVWVAFRRWPPASARAAWRIGLLWLLMTVAFEFGFGHYVAGHSWQRLFADYNLAAGRVWALFLIWMFTMPYLIYRLGRAGTDSPD